MAIPESQFDTWSRQGSIAQSCDTYRSIRNALNSRTAYADRDYEVFLQGSYGNDTNVYSESDVDVVILLHDAYAFDLTRLPALQQGAFNNATENATYRHADFKRDVLHALEKAFGYDVVDGNKAIAVKANGTRRKADVIVAIEFRRYAQFRSLDDETFTPGICFFDASGRRVVNYPKFHSENCTTKHQETYEWYKPMVRIFKNARRHMVEKGIIEAKLAPSYYIEGLLYNVPSEHFGKNYVSTFTNCYDWLVQADRKELLCANEQYFLLRGDPLVTWQDENCAAFLNGIRELWAQW